MKFFDPTRHSAVATGQNKQDAPALAAGVFKARIGKLAAQKPEHRVAAAETTAPLLKAAPETLGEAD